MKKELIFDQSGFDFDYDTIYCIESNGNFRVIADFRTRDGLPLYIPPMTIWGYPVILADDGSWGYGFNKWDSTEKCYVHKKETKKKMKHRKLFCEISPLCYEISVTKCCILRRLRDLFSRARFCRKRLAGLLPVVIYKHKSLIRRQLGDVDMILQNNKAVNLSLAAPKISGVLIQPGETFSLWHLVGKTSVRKGYKEGLMIKRGKPDRGIGGGLCQLSNLIHWIVLHTPFEITEHHHHDGMDLFPDFGRQVPFGVGTSISYNYLDYRFKNTTEQTFQLIVYTDEKYLNAELRAEKPLPLKYHIESRNEHFIQEDGIWYRNGEVWRQGIDKSSGRVSEDKLIKTNHAQVMYDKKYIPAEKQK